MEINNALHRTGPIAAGEQRVTTQGECRINPGAGIDYELFMDCIHCGLCTASCPTYVETGNENDGPRGRIYLMRAVTDGRIDVTPQVKGHLELCLDCRACETACPSGVQYGKLIEPFRIAMENNRSGEPGKDWFRDWILFRIFPYPNRLRLALRPGRWAERLLMNALLKQSGLIRLLPSPIQQMVRLLPPSAKDEGALPEFLPAKGTKRATVALFTGCVGDGVFRHVNWATARVLQENGCDVHVPRSQACCGAIHFHAGSSEPAREFADANVAAFDSPKFDAVINNIAGCGSMLKDYGHHWAHEAKQNEAAEADLAQQGRESLAAKMRDINEFLDELGLIPPAGEIPMVATYHDACHLVHAQKVREAPRNLLSQVPGLRLQPLGESELCCGAAGSYNLTQPEMAQRLGARKIGNVAATGAEAVISSNAGCTLQMVRHARELGHTCHVAHPMEILDWSYRGVPPRWR